MDWSKPSAFLITPRFISYRWLCTNKPDMTGAFSWFTAITPALLDRQNYLRSLCPEFFHHKLKGERKQSHGWNNPVWCANRQMFYIDSTEIFCILWYRFTQKYLKVQIGFYVLCILFNLRWGLVFFAIPRIPQILHSACLRRMATKQ